LNASEHAGEDCGVLPPLRARAKGTAHGDIVELQEVRRAFPAGGGVEEAGAAGDGSGAAEEAAGVF
jgi:hypothetical protein